MARNLVLLSVVLAIIAGSTGCSTARPWQNLPLQRGDVAGGYRLNQPGPAQAEALTVVVTFSGGGARAAAFAYGVLHELERTRFEWQGREVSLLDEVDLIGGVSGGSIAAAYYAAFGKRMFKDFEREFLARDFQGTLIARTLRPTTMHRLSSPWFGRSHVLMERLDELFKGATYGDLERRGCGPYLLITATDLSAGAAFEFTQEQFDLICSDLSSVPLSFAVAASAAVPVLLSPMTLKNFSAACTAPLGVNPRFVTSDFRARLLAAQESGYQDHGRRPYVHLIDGGLADNLGIRRLFESAIARGWTDEPGQASEQPIERLVVIVVNAQPAVPHRIDDSDAVPGLLQVIDTLVHSSGAHRTRETLEFLEDIVNRWRDELSRAEPGTAMFGLNAAGLYFIPVSFEDVDNPVQRDALRSIPTSFSIAPADRDGVVRAARKALENAPEFRRLRADLRARDD